MALGPQWRVTSAEVITHSGGFKISDGPSGVISEDPFPQVAWRGSTLVFTTRFGTPIEPRNFSRSYDNRIKTAGVPKITAHDARRT